jgi:hypothetical protein
MMANIDDTKAPIVEEVVEPSSITDELESSLFMLRDQDEEAHEAVTSMMTVISDELTGTNYLTLTSDLSWNPATAKVANVTAAALQIESYLNEKDPHNLGDLLEAIYSLTVEVIRKHKFLKNKL